MKRILSTIILTITCITGSELCLAESPTPHTNVRMNPLSLAIGGVNAGVDVGISDKTSLGVEGAYIKDTSKILATKGKAWGLGLRATHHASGMSEDSFISSVSLEKSRLDISEDSCLNSGDGLSAKGLLGYRWIHSSGLNSSLAGGILRVHSKKEGSKSYNETSSLPVLELNVGWQV